MFSFLTVIAIVGGYSLIGCLFWMAILRIIQGALFGITTATSSTVAIDITSTTRRSEGNIHFNWAGRLGMAFGPMIGLLLFSFSDLQTVLYASIASGFAGFLCMALIKVPFRAPIGAKPFFYRSFSSFPRVGNIRQSGTDFYNLRNADINY